MTTTLQGKIALVTGGSSGIGLASATEFAAQGATVFITGRRQAELDAAVGHIGHGAVALQADSSKLADLDRVIARIEADHGRLDILMVNAGILEKAPVTAITEAHFDKIFDINVKGLVFTVQKALPLMPDGSAIVLLSSTVAGKGLPGGSIYAASKAAIRSFARVWVSDLKDRRIRVNAISPGPIHTLGLTGGMGDADSIKKVTAAMASQIPLGRLGEPGEIGKVAAFLASDAASFVNGADIQVDGGWAQI